jgi:hypothetical protein
MNENFPCRCGHDKRVHQNNPHIYCWYCGVAGTWENCNAGFVPDNLKYLEEKYNKQILDKYRSKI